MRALLEANADPNAEDDQGCTPLQEVFGHPGMRHSEDKLRSMFILLRDAGADVNRLLPEKVGKGQCESCEGRKVCWLVSKLSVPVKPD